MLGLRAPNTKGWVTRIGIRMTAMAFTHPIHSARFDAMSGDKQTLGCKSSTPTATLFRIARGLSGPPERLQCQLLIGVTGESVRLVHIIELSIHLI